jgi:hypothetical protein
LISNLNQAPAFQIVVGNDMQQMFFGESLSWAQIVAVLEALELEINTPRTSG